MNCRDFDRIWNQSLDADRPGASPGPAWPSLERDLREHAESCPSCRVRHHRFETLRQALDAWTGRPQLRPAPSPGSADRIIAALVRPEPARGGRRRIVRPRVAAFALASAAAAGLAVVGPRLLEPKPTTDAPASSAAPASPSLKRGLLGAAVGDATAASWELALLASEPAARLGKEMIDASFDADADADADLFPPADTPTATDVPVLDADSFSPDLINQMGGLLAEGVRPLSTSARRAFGFLRAPNTEKPQRPVRPSAGKGA